MLFNQTLTYISLFSGAGVGYYGLLEEGFECVATNKILEKRLNIQRINRKCKFDESYISGDIKKPETKEKILKQIEFYSKKFGNDRVDSVVATPPCQGMSVANHIKIAFLTILKQQFKSTWGRLNWNKISPTIDTRFDTPSNGTNSHLSRPEKPPRYKVLAIIISFMAIKRAFASKSVTLCLLF